MFAGVGVTDVIFSATIKFGLSTFESGQLFGDAWNHLAMIISICVSGTDSIFPRA